MAVYLLLAFWGMSEIKFIDHQHIEFENVLSYIIRVDAEKLPALLEYIIQNIDALGLEITGNIVFTISEIHEFANRCIFDVEVLVPVNKAFPSSERYIYKPRFRLVNAIVYRIGNSTHELVGARGELMKYISDKRLQAISNIYYIASFSRQSIEIEYYDVIVSVNDNVL